MSTIFLNVGTGANGVASATVTLQAFADWFAGQNGEMLNFELTNPQSPAVVQAISLISGANTISATNCPAIATAAGCFIVPPPANGTTITLKGAAGDAGIAISPTAPTMLSLTNPPLSSFVLTTNSTITNLFIVWF